MVAVSLKKKIVKCTLCFFLFPFLFFSFHFLFLYIFWIIHLQQLICIHIHSFSSLYIYNTPNPSLWVSAGQIELPLVPSLYRVFSSAISSTANITSHSSIPFFFFNRTATPETYSLSLRYALPILQQTYCKWVYIFLWKQPHLTCCHWVNLWWSN